MQLFFFFSQPLFFKQKIYGFIYLTTIKTISNANLNIIYIKKGLIHKRNMQHFLLLCSFAYIKKIKYTS